MISDTVESVVERVFIFNFDYSLIIIIIFTATIFDALEFARKAFALTDEWYGMTMDDIRELEERIKAELEVKLKPNNEFITTSTLNNYINTQI